MKRKEQWIWIAVAISIFLLFVNSPRAETQTVSEKQNARKAQMETFQADQKFEEHKKGYISGPADPQANPYTVPQSGYIRLKTRETPEGSTTVGVINGRYVRIIAEKKE